MPESILIADDHPIFRHGLREVIQSSGQFEVVAEAGDGVQALRLLRLHRPSMAVLDIAMPEADGLDVLAQVMRWPDAPRVVMLTMYDDTGYLRAAVELGAFGYLLKEHVESEVIRCLLTVRRGRRYLGSGLPGRIDEHGDPSLTAPVELLSPAERRVLHLVAEYKSSREIAELLSISPKTVENHRANMVRKLEIRGANALLRFALEHYRSGHDN